MSKYFEKNLKKTFKRTLNNFRPKSRKGLGMGLGKGFKNMIPQDPFVHSMSARGVKTGEKISIVKTDMSDWKWNLRFIRHGLYAGDGKFFKTKKVAEKYARKYMKLNAKGISEEMLEKFGRLDGEFSPENLTCDGELSNLQVRKKYAMLMREWRALEKEVGHKVSRDEVEDWLIKKLNAKGELTKKQLLKEITKLQKEYDNMERLKEDVEVNMIDEKDKREREYYEDDLDYYENSIEEISEKLDKTNDQLRKVNK